MEKNMKITENMTLGDIVLLKEFEAYKNAIKFDGEELELSLNEKTGDREFFTTLKENVMRKYIIPFLLVTMCFAGCNKKVETVEPKQTDNAEIEAAVQEEDTMEDIEEPSAVSMANPMQELTDEYEIRDLGHCNFAPKEAKDVKSFLIDGKLFEQQFEYGDAKCTLRVQPGDEFDDISGMYYEWSSDTEMVYPFEGSHWLRYEGDGEYVEVLNWYDADEKVNCSLSILSDKQGISAVEVVDEVLPLRVKNRKPKNADDAEIEGLTTVKNIEDCFNSFIDFIGFQSFYNGIQFDELNDDVRLALAVFCAQTNSTDFETDDTGSYQVVLEDDIKAAMLDLFGEAFDIKADNETDENSQFVIQADNSAYVKLGDWGLVAPELEIPAISEEPDSNGEYSMSALYYPHDYETDHVARNISSYICYVKIKPNKESKYGISIVEMKGEITE